MPEDRYKIHDHIDGRSSVLLLAPRRSAPDNEACIDLLTGAEPGEANVLSVTFSRTPDERLALWRREVGEPLPKRATIVDAGSPATVASQTAASEEFPSLSVDALPSDAELIDVGIAIARHLSDWESTAESTFLCLHSLSAVLDSFDRERALSLVRGLNDLCNCQDVVAHHHMDPDAHPEDTVAAFRPQYDVVLEHDPDRGWVVSDGDAPAGSPAVTRSASSPGANPGSTSGKSGLTPVPYSLDAVLDVLSNSRRREILYYLRGRSRETTVSVDRLVELVRVHEGRAPDRESSHTADQVRASLAHTHLPKLDDMGIVTYDAGTNVVEYNPNAALESCLEYVAMLEFG